LICIALAAHALSPEEKKARAQAAKVKKQQMESCLTLVRSFYHTEEKMVQEFVDTHPTTDKGRLTSKFLSRMMLKCTKDVTPDQVDFLQSWKSKPTELDYTSHDYLIQLDWE
jgi:hypothetical protein